MKFVIYGNEQKYQINGWYLYVVQATDSVDKSVFFRWAKSRVDDWMFKAWNDKSKRARLFERKYFMSAGEAYDAGKAECLK